MTPKPDAQMPFDPKTHKFGMAYKIGDSLFYPYKYVDQAKSVCGSVLWQGNTEWSHQCNPASQVIRAPEHDLVPRPDVEKLIEALNMAAGRFEGLGYNEYADYCSLAVKRSRGDLT